MQTRTMRIGTAGALALAFIGWLSASVHAEPAAKATTGVAVVELFTSQGCSSCPPADQLLGQLIARAKTNKTRVYALAFHVDYWDRLRWKDPFASRAATQRQYAYARALEAKQVYTPQMVVNGSEEFVGSEQEQAKKAIAAALATKAEATITLKQKPTRKKDSIDIGFTVIGATKGAVLVVAFVESSQTTKVLRGENARRTLKDYNVVRAFKLVELARGLTGEVTLDLPTIGSGRVIAFVQQRNHGKIVGANDIEVSLTKPNGAER